MPMLKVVQIHALFSYVMSKIYSICCDIHICQVFIRKHVIVFTARIVRAVKTITNYNYSALQALY